MEFQTNPAERLTAFIERAQAHHEESASDALMQILSVGERDIAVMLRRYAEVLGIARGCMAYANALRERDERIPTVGVDAVHTVVAALETVRFDAPWKHCLNAMGTNPVLGVSWLIPHYPKDLVSPEEINSWRERMLAALVEVRAVLDGVGPAQRDLAWLRTHRAVARILDYLNAIEVEGLEAAERAWAAALTLEGMMAKKGASKGWKQDLAQRVKVVAEIARTVTTLIQAGMALSGAATVTDEMPALPAPVEIKLLGSGTSEGLA